jgi:hypothetical protein
MHTSFCYSLLHQCPGHAGVAPGQELVLQIKEITQKAKSSGKFYSIRSFLFGFWNNILGMFAFVRFRQAASKHLSDRREYIDMILQRKSD